MRTLAIVGSLFIAGTASADIGISFGIGTSFGFCGSGIGIYSGISIGGHSGWYAPTYRPYHPYSGWCGDSWGRGQEWGWGYRGYDDDRWYRPRHHRYSHSYDRHDGWYGTRMNRDTVQDRRVRRPDPKPVVVAEVSAEKRLADAWRFLDQGQASRAQGYFALAASKDPTDARAKLGFALASAELGDDARAAWSAQRAIGVDEGELATLDLPESCQQVLAGLIDQWNNDGNPLAGELTLALGQDAALDPVGSDGATMPASTTPTPDVGRHPGTRPALTSG